MNQQEITEGTETEWPQCGKAAAGDGGMAGLGDFGTGRVWEEDEHEDEKPYLRLRLRRAGSARLCGSFGQIKIILSTFYYDGQEGLIYRMFHSQ